MAELLRRQLVGQVKISTDPTSFERSPVLRFGVFELDRHNRELRRQGRRLRLQDQPFQVLALLLERAGDVVTRDELRQKLWSSTVYVDFDHGLNNAIARLREALGDDAATPHFIETLPRLGYRFIYPIGEEPTAADEVGTPAPPAQGVELSAAHDAARPTGNGRVGVSRWATRQAIATAGIGAAMVMLALLAGWWISRRPVAETPATAALTKEPSIAVLPFANLSSDPESEHFADGLTQELLDRLADVRGLEVVGRTSSYYFKGKQEPLPVIARTLRVNHVLEGSVRRSGTRVRITAQLVDAAEGRHLWSRTFDREFTDIFQIQEDIARAVATALQVKLLDTDERRLRKRGTGDAEAYRLYVIANAHLRGLAVKRDLATAKHLFEQAIARDPQFAAAHAGLARYHFVRAWTSLTDVDDGVRLGLEAAERAVALDPESSEALQARANFAMWRYRFLGDFQAYTQAHRDYRRAIQLDPSNEAVIFDYGRAVLWHEPDLARALFDRVVELEPLARGARGMGAVALSIRGSPVAARQRIRELADGIVGGHGADAIYEAGLDLYRGQLDEAVVSTREALARPGLELPILLWGLYMSLGDPAAASEALDTGDTDLAGVLRETAMLTMHGRYAEAFEYLERHRGDHERSRVLDLPTARLALIAGHPGRALAILQHRLPDLFTGAEPVNGLNVIPALDLAAAWAGTGQQASSRQLLGRIAAFLDGPDVPRLPMFLYLRARVHALAGESDLAVQALVRAYEAGFRTTWAVDLHPQPLFYLDSIEVDPAFAALRADPRYQDWLARTRTDNARMLGQLRTRDAARPAT